MNWRSLSVRLGKYSGIGALCVGWVTIFVSIAANPQFSWLRNALSDLGAVGKTYAFIFNGGLSIAAILAMIHSIYLLWFLRGKIFPIASAIFLSTALHLLLIAIFPEGTEPHTTVSYEFFTFAGIAIMLFGASGLLEKRKTSGAILIILSLAGFIGAALIKWPSTALLETYVLILITISLALMLLRILSAMLCS